MASVAGTKRLSGREIKSMAMIDRNALKKLTTVKGRGVEQTMTRITTTYSTIPDNHPLFDLPTVFKG
jgi:hypothetical protein